LGAAWENAGDKNWERSNASVRSIPPTWWSVPRNILFVLVMKSLIILGFVKQMKWH
jgi:hypothetical protein